MGTIQTLDEDRSNGHLKFRPRAPPHEPEARKTLAGGETTGQRPRNTNRALEGREKGTRGLAGTIAGEHSNASRAPAGAHPESGVVGQSGSGGSRSLRDLHHRLTSFEPPARPNLQYQV